MMPPALRPNSAVKLLVKMRNSATASGLGLNTTPLLSRLLLLPPSSKNVTESERPPATVKPPGLPSPGLVSFTPACSSARWSTLRPVVGGVEWGVDNLPARARLPQRRIDRFHGGRSHRDFDRFVACADFQHRVKAQDLIDLQGQFIERQPFEPPLFNGRAICPQRQRRDLKAAIRGRNGFARNARRHIGHDDFGAHDDSTRWIRDGSDNASP